MDPDETVTEKSARLHREAIAAALIARLAVATAPTCDVIPAVAQPL